MVAGRVRMSFNDTTGYEDWDRVKGLLVKDEAACFVQACD